MRKCVIPNSEADPSANKRSIGNPIRPQADLCAVVCVCVFVRVHGCVYVSCVCEGREKTNLYLSSQQDQLGILNKQKLEQ